MNSIQVEGRFDAGGLFQPATIFVDSTRYDVLAVGRRWTVEEEECLLVQTSAGVFELGYRPDAGWRLRRRITPPAYL